MATSIFFNGRVISVPGSYTEVDASGLEQIGLGASGIVALIGTAEGGRPVSAIEETKDFIRLGKPERVRQAFRSGDLREAGGILFEPAKDPDITAGAQEIVAMKVNPATQSTATLANAQGDALKVTSRDYGTFTGQINLSIAPGTSKGKLISITFEDIVEGVDDLSGDDIFQLTYVGGANGWGTMSALVAPGGNIQADATRAFAGLDSDVGTQLGSNTEIEVVSDNPADIGKQITVWGLDGVGDLVREVLALNGTSVVVGTQVFSALLGAEAAGTAGNTTVRPSGGGAAVFTVVTNSSSGLYVGEQMYVTGGPVTIVADGPSTAQVVVAGTNAAGSLILEKPFPKQRSIVWLDRCVVSAPPGPAPPRLRPHPGESKCHEVVGDVLFGARSPTTARGLASRPHASFPAGPQTVRGVEGTRPSRLKY